MTTQRAVLMVPLRGTPEAVGRAREVVRGQLGAGMIPAALRDLLIVVSDLVSAAVTDVAHEAGDTVHLRVYRSDDGVRVEVAVPAARLVGRRRQPLELVQALCARCGTRQDAERGLAAWAEMPFAPPRAPVAAVA